MLWAMADGPEFSPYAFDAKTPSNSIYDDLVTRPAIVIQGNRRWLWHMSLQRWSFERHFLFHKSSDADVLKNSLISIWTK